MATLSFADIASTKFQDLDKPPLAPVGVYRFRVTKAHTLSESKSGQWDILTFPIQAQEAVDVADFEDFKGNVTSIFNMIRFMFNKEDKVAFDRTAQDLQRFLVQHLKVADEGTPLDKAMENAVGAEFLGTVSWRPDDRNPGEMQVDVRRTAPLE